MIAASDIQRIRLRVRRVLPAIEKIEKNRKLKPICDMGEAELRLLQQRISEAITQKTQEEFEAAAQDLARKSKELGVDPMMIAARAIRRIRGSGLALKRSAS